MVGLYRSRGTFPYLGFEAFRFMLLNIQALRAIAALLVVVVHLEVLGAAMGLGPDIFAVFAVGVDLFFVISGFIMVHTTASKQVSPQGFMLDRLLRIAPLYWVLTLAVFTVALCKPALLAATQANWAALAQSLAFIPYERADGTIRPILFVGWSLNLEMAFYLIFALALPIKSLGHRVATAIGTLLLAVAIGIAMKHRLGPAFSFLTQPMLLEFAAGMVIGWLYPRFSNSRRVAWLAAFTGCGGLIALVVMAQWPWPGGWPTSLPAAVTVVLCALLAEKGRLALRWRPVLAMGNASYALYLIHPFVTQGWTLLCVRSGLLTASSAPVLMVAALGSAIVAGMAAHIWIERPLGQMARRVVSSLRRVHTTPQMAGGMS